jgi:hypothetical protein
LEGATNSSPLNTWTFVCFTADLGNATGLRLYVNGVEDPNSPASLAGYVGINATGFPLFVGTTVVGSGGFNGFIDDVRLYNRILSPAEITQLYTGALDANITFNIYQSGTSTNLSSVGVDWNVNAYDLANQTSPFTQDVNMGTYSIIFSKTGYDSNTIVLAADVNKIVTVYLNPSMSDANITFNVYGIGTNTNLTGVNFDWNVNAYDINDQNSPITQDVNKGSYLVTISKTGYDSNIGILIVADANKSYSIYLNHTNPDYNTGLVGWWKLDETGGTIGFYTADLVG